MADKDKDKDTFTARDLKHFYTGLAELNLENLRKYLSQDIFKKGTRKPSALELGQFEGYADALNDIGADEKIYKEVISIIEPIMMTG